MANIKFEYLFRDENNYKEYGEVIFNNPNNLSLEKISKNITENLIEGSWFYPDVWEIPKFSFHRTTSFGVNDYRWYEFVRVSNTKEIATIKRSINELLILIKPNKLQDDRNSRKNSQPQTLSFNIKSQLGAPSILLNAAKSTNFIYKITGLDLEQNLINEINSIETRSKIKDRLKRIQEEGGSFQFTGTEKSIFSNNLILIDSLLPDIISEMVFQYYSSGASTVSELVKTTEELNPLNFNQEFNHQFYSYKTKRFLTDVALGMMPATVWTGKYDATGGYLIVKPDGDIRCYHIYNRNDFENYLLNNTRLETASSSRHKFGKIYEEDGELFFKLNLQIRFLK